jgi:hypothetical protein
MKQKYNIESEKVDYVNELKPSLKSVSRIWIFILLLMSCVIFIYISTICTGLPWLRDLSINLAAGSIWSLATVFIIDYLINKEKVSKLIAVNKLGHHGLLSYIRILMLRIMRDFNFITKKEMFDFMDNSEDKFRLFIKDAKTIAKLNGLSSLSKENISFIRKVNKTIKNGWEYLSKNIDHFKPFPDPLLVHKINIEMSYASGTVSAGEKMFGFYYRELPKKIDKTEMARMKPGMEILWKIISNGMERPERSLKNYYLNSFNFLLELSDRCEKENIFIDI